MTAVPIRRKFTDFTDRKGRAAFIAKAFAAELAASASVLDVGSDVNTLKQLVGPKVTGIDLYGEPDIRVDFEQDQLTRFKDREFEMVVCTEVLEHLDNFHDMARECFRVSDRYVLISLPNSLSLFTKWNIVFHGTAGKFYGLPLEKPDDRHRWFFGYQDVDRFFARWAPAWGFAATKKFLTINFSDSWRGKLARIATKFFRLNNASQSYWMLFERER